MTKILTTKNLPKRSKEFQSFFKMWDKTWNKLINNPYHLLVKDLDIDFTELSIVLDNDVCYSYQEWSYQHEIPQVSWDGSKV